MIAGLGLFFSGVKIVSNSMKNITSHKFRLMVSRWTGNHFLTAFWGFISGAVSQSSSNTVFILIGLVSSGLMKVRTALPIILWSNVGTTVLIFLVAINLNLGILILMGLSGIFYGFHNGNRRENLYSSLFGISLLLFGFQLLKTGSQPLAEMQFINDIFSFTSGSYVLPILIGAGLRLVIHSSSTVAVLIMAISHAGLIGTDQVILMIFGMGIGEAGTVALLSSGMKGISRQLALFKIIESSVVAGILILITYIEILWDIPLIKSAIVYAGANIEQQTAYTFLIAKITPILLFSFLYNPIYRFLVKISPPTSEEDLSKTFFINENSMNDTSMALLLIEKEQIRIFERMPEYIDNIRVENSIPVVHHFLVIRKSNLALMNEIELYLKRIVNSNLSQDDTEQYVILQNRQNLLKSIDDAVFHYVQTIYDSQTGSNLEELIQSSAESLHFNLITALETTRTSEKADIEILLNITDDKGGLMERIRKSYLNGDNLLNSDEKTVLLYVTDLFQRTVWLINNWAKTLKPVDIS